MALSAGCDPTIGAPMAISGPSSEGGIIYPWKTFAEKRYC
jgi:hypothetical protein